jgi:hypothetical protein
MGRKAVNTFDKTTLNERGYYQKGWKTQSV